MHLKGMVFSIVDLQTLLRRANMLCWPQVVFSILTGSFAAHGRVARADGAPITLYMPPHVYRSRFPSVAASNSGSPSETVSHPVYYIDY
jgi:hypothetical protein